MSYCKLKIGVAAVLLATPLAFSSDLKIGLLLGETGALSRSAEAARNGAMIAASLGKAHKELLSGWRLAVPRGDTQVLAQPAIAAANRLINSGVVGLDGPQSSGVSLAVSSYLNSNHRELLIISPSATSPELSKPANDPNDYFFRTVLPDSQQGPALARLIWSKGIKRIGVMYVNNQYGKGLSDATVAAFAKLSGTRPHAVPYEPSQASYDSEVRLMSKGSGGHCVFIAYPDDGGLKAVKAAVSGGYCKFVIFADGMASSDVAQALVSLPKGRVFGVAPVASFEIPDSLRKKNLSKREKIELTKLKDMAAATKAFQNRYKARYKELPSSGYAYTSYSAFNLLMLSAARTLKEGFSPEKNITMFRKKMREALRSMTNMDYVEAVRKGIATKPGDVMGALKRIKEGLPVQYIGINSTLRLDQAGDPEPSRNSFSAFEIKKEKMADGKMKGIISYRPMP